MRRMPTVSLSASRRPLASAVLLLAFGVPATAAAQRSASDRSDAPLGDSYRYDYRITGDGESSGGSTTVLGDRVRTAADNGRSDDWLLYDGGKGSVAVVHPRDRTYSTTDADRFANVIGVAMRAVGTVLTMRLRDVDISARRLGPGEPIDGHPTLRYRIVQAYVASIGIFGASEDTRMHVVTDYWVPTDIRIARNPILELVTSAPNALALRDQDFVEQTDNLRRGLFTGTPLRTVVTVSETKHDGAETSKAVEIHLSNLRPATPRPALFTIPADYTLTSDWSFDARGTR